MKRNSSTAPRCILLAVLISICCHASYAQPKSKTEPHWGNNPVTNKKYPEGSTKTTTVTTDDKTLDKVIRMEIKDNKQIVYEVETWRLTIDRRFEHEKIRMTPSGKILSKTTTHFQIRKLDDGNEIFEALLDCGFDISGHKVTNYTYVRNEEGKWVDKRTGEPVNNLDKDYLDGLGMEEMKRYYDLELRLDYIFPNTPEPPCKQQQSGNCQPKAELFVGYSALLGDRGTESEFFPVGARVSYTHALNSDSRIGLGIDGSIHTKKDGDLTLTRSFVLAKGQYNLGDPGNCNQKIQFEVHLLAGMGFEKLKYKAGYADYSSSGSGPAFGAGGGANMKLSEKIAIKAQADFIAVKFKNTDVLTKNFRFSLGVNFIL
ncbi:MAG: outer membrane beta-barrel protein [Chitinophagaceae bacterium]|nr:outer membrane beta-barrel protein [Chitinophagaceae bacterium]MCW5926588.1 outer membrane beta-barrel protein [Chitinophagaceae bacterium]